MNILLTGCAGFIGSHTLEKILGLGYHVIGVDNFDPFYSRSIKTQNLSNAVGSDNFQLVDADLANLDTYKKIDFINGEKSIDAIIHLAAKAGVRPSIEDPLGYQRANVIATQNLLEYAKKHSIKQFVLASSSSVYGINPNVPWKENDLVLQPISPYASTKVSCELMGHVYSQLYGIRFLGLRFFTVYGPRQRPDLAINKFVSLMDKNLPIPVFGDGSSRRDYTYVNDIVDGIISALTYDKTNYEIFNLGNDKTISLSEMICAIEASLGKKAFIDRKPEQAGDVSQTWADIEKSKKYLDYCPKYSFQEGLNSFIAYQKNY